ncbi:MAG TPA: AAA family ATPase [Gemmatimonadales bacterium]|nr:AAA family ATPase [Gemmatimonadales bacterium]
MIQLRLLGPLEILVDGAPAPPRLRWRKHAALLAYLALQGSRPHARDRLIAMLWPDKPDAGARHSLNEAVRVIRRAAGGDAIVSGVGDLRLLPGFVETDADELARHLARGAATAAAQLIRGAFLEGFALGDSNEFEQWLDAERRAWQARMLGALDSASREEWHRGDATAAAELARRAVALDPASEPATQRLMEALALAGDRAGALVAHAEMESALQEFGAVPGPALRRLAGLIRAGTLRSDGKANATAYEGTRRLRLIERAAQLSALSSAWSQCRTERRSTLLLIVGRDGSGRSRLATELARHAQLDGAAVALAHAVPGDQAVDCSGLVALARGGLLDAPGIGGAAAESLGALAAAIPEWQDRFPAVVPVKGSLPPAFADVVRAAASAGPVLLIHDDVRWSDEASLAAELALLRDCTALPLAILLTVRPDDELPVVDRARAHIGREWQGAVVEVPPLTLPGLTELVADRFPEWTPDAQERLARRLLADSAGQPALVGELLSAIAAGLPADTGSWPAPSRTLDATFPADQPDAITAAVRVNFGCLNAVDREVLAALAALGPRVDPALLERSLGRPLSDLAGSLDRLEAQCWLESDARGYAFLARAVRNVIDRDFVTPGARRRLRERGGPDPVA